jgi:hypothetical protein
MQPNSSCRPRLEVEVLEERWVLSSVTTLRGQLAPSLPQVAAIVAPDSGNDHISLPPGQAKKADTLAVSLPGDDSGMLWSGGSLSGKDSTPATIQADDSDKHGKGHDKSPKDNEGDNEGDDDIIRALTRGRSAHSTRVQGNGQETPQDTSASSSAHKVAAASGSAAAPLAAATVVQGEPRASGSTASSPSPAPVAPVAAPHAIAPAVLADDEVASASGPEAAQEEPKQSSAPSAGLPGGAALVTAAQEQRLVLGHGGGTVRVAALGFVPVPAGASAPVPGSVHVSALRLFLHGAGGSAVALEEVHPLTGLAPQVAEQLLGLAAVEGAALAANLRALLEQLDAVGGKLVASPWRLGPAPWVLAGGAMAVTLEMGRRYLRQRRRRRRSLVSGAEAPLLFTGVGRLSMAEDP